MYSFQPLLSFSFYQKRTVFFIELIAVLREQLLELMLDVFDIINSNSL